MHSLSTVQAHAQSCLTASPVLAAFGDPILYSPFQDRTASAALIEERLRTTGVCIEISGVSAVSAEALRLGTTHARGIFEVRIAESLSTAHTPGDAALREEVIRAITQRTRQLVEWESFGPDDSLMEQGYVLNVITFSIPILVN